MQSEYFPEAAANALQLTSRSHEQMEQFRTAHETQVLTILFSDLVGSTRLQSEVGTVQAAELVRQHRAIFREVLQKFDGCEIETAGDSFLAVFAAPSAGVNFALHMQAAMRRARQATPQLPSVRVGVHQGQVVVERHEAGPKALDIYGLQISTTARIMDLAQGGQILCSRAVFDDARAILRSEDLRDLKPVGWQNHGPYNFKGVEDSYDVCEVGEQGEAPFVPPPAGAKGWPAGQGEEELGWRPAAGVVVPGTNWLLQERLGKEDDPNRAGAQFRGEFGEVWKAWNASQKHHEVFKFCFKRDQVPVLKREARLLKRLQKHRHPNLVEVYDITEGDSPPYYLEMEYVEGPTLEEWLATDPLLKERLEIVAQVAEALDTVHAAGIYHRDIKPSNILLTRREDGALQAKLTDFGLGAAEDTELLRSIYVSHVEGVAGTWDYIAPEIRKGSNASPQSDLYSLGLTLFQIVNGDTRSLAGPGWEQHIESEVLRNDIAKCMDMDPSRRWRRGADLAIALRTHDERVERLRLEQAREAQRRQRIILATVSVLLLVFAALSAVAVTQWFRADVSERRARQAASQAEFSLACKLLDRGHNREAYARLAYALRLVPTNKVAAMMGLSCIEMQTIPREQMSIKGRDEFASATYSTDGRFIVTASFGGTARIWDAMTGTALGNALQHSNKVWFATFSPDGRSVATASSDLTTQIWDARTAQRIGRPFEHKDWVVSAAYSPNGRYIVTADWGGNSARIWDTDTGLPVGLLPHTKKVRFATFSPDGRSIITSCWDFAARIWDAKTGESQGKPLLHGEEVYHAGFNHDGRYVLTSSLDKKARVWDVGTGRVIGKPMEHNGGVRSATFSPDERWVVTACRDENVRIWDVATGQVVGPPLQHNGIVHFAEFSPDGRFIVSASADDTVRIWYATTGQLTAFPLCHTQAVNSAKFSPDGRFVVSACSDHTVRIWDARTGREIGQLVGHNGKVWTASFSSDGKRIVTASADRTARIWDLQTQQLLGVLEHREDEVVGASFSRDGKLVVTASWDHTARIWDAETCKAIGILQKDDEPLYGVQFSPDGRYIVTASWGRFAQIWEVANRRAVGQPLQHNGPVYSSSFSPDGRFVVTASDDHTARIWKTVTGKAVSEPLQHNNVVNSAVFSPDGQLVATACDDHTAQIWDVRTGSPCSKPLRHEGMVKSVAFSPDGQFLVTACEDGTARIWNVSYTKTIASSDWRGGETLAMILESISETTIDTTTDVVVRTPNDLFSLKKRLNSRPETLAPYGEVLTWFFSDPTTRPIWPSSPHKVPQLVARLRELKQPWAQQAAYELNPVDSLTLLIIAGNEKDLQRQSYQRRCALNRLSDDATAYSNAISILRKQGEDVLARSLLKQALAKFPDSKELQNQP